MVTVRANTQLGFKDGPYIGNQAHSPGMILNITSNAQIQQMVDTKIAWRIADSMQYGNVELHQDFYGKDRMVSAVWNAK